MTAYYTRYLEESIKESISFGKIIIVLGARQTGKSTMLKRLLPEAHIKINLQEPARRNEFTRNPQLLIKIAQGVEEGRMTIFIDEIQKVPELLDAVQYLYDEYPDKYQFILTGSSARKLAKESSNLLPGRAHLFHLFPVSLVEKSGRGILGVKSTSGNHFPESSLEDVLLYGSLPGISLESKKSAKKTLDSYVDLYLDEEVRKENLVKNISAFSQFLQLAALSSNHPISYSNLSMETGVSVNGIKEYYNILKETYIGYIIPAFSKNVRKRILSTPKFIFFDNGVRNSCARVGHSPELLTISNGELFEQWVGTELYHQLSMLGREYGLSYYRTVGGVEIDYIITTPHTIIPIEVKWTQSPREKDAKHLKAFLKDHPNIEMGYIICRCREPQKIADKIMAIPWSNLSRIK